MKIATGSGPSKPQEPQEKAVKASAKPTRAPIPIKSAKSEPDEKQEAKKADEFPASSAFGKLSSEVEKLIDECVEVQKRHKEDDLRVKEIKARLAVIVEGKSAPGIKHGSIAVYYRGYKTKMTLDPILLVENGVKASVISKSYKESAPFLDMTITDLNKPRKKKAGEE